MVLDTASIPPLVFCRLAAGAHHASPDACPAATIFCAQAVDVLLTGTKQSLFGCRATEEQVKLWPSWNFESQGARDGLQRVGNFKRLKPQSGCLGAVGFD